MWSDINNKIATVYTQLKNIFKEYKIIHDLK